jgi:CRISPR-associated protein Csm2
MKETRGSRQPGRANPARGGGRPFQGRGNQPAVILPVPKRIQYFKDPGRKELDSDLLDNKAAQWAKDFKDLKVSQMRRFYDELKAIERKMMVGDQGQREANFLRDRALVTMFKAKAVYAEKRKVAPRAFTQFIFDHEASIQTFEDFQAFVKIFEAVLAYHRFFSKE